jgi:hypothetical protein
VRSRWPTLAAALGLAALASALAVGGAFEREPARGGPASAAPADGDLLAPAGSGGDGDLLAPAERVGAPVDPPALTDDPLATRALPPLPLPAFDPAVPPRWIAAASGPVPELNQVSLEQDMALAAEVLGPGGRVLFGAGPGTLTVQELAPPRDVDLVAAVLGELFAPRGRDVHYRPTRLVTAEPATANALIGALDHALAGGPEPLLVWLGGHGNMGERPRHNSVSLWAQSELSVVELSLRLDESPRPVRLVVTTCFSGGFADVVFRGADEAQGGSDGERCGVFAAPWDREATGCDPNPDRAAQDGYALHVLEALRGRDREGNPLPPRVLDIDGDGRISLLEAHTRARIASASADVPTTTAERWLRHAAPSHGPEQVVALPEEDAVVAALAERLGVVGREAGAPLELQRIEDGLEAVLRSLDDAHAMEEAAYRSAAAALFARWPVLDDPWHPDHARMLARHRRAILEHIERSESYADWIAAREEVDRLTARSWELRLRAAPYERLSRALETKQLAARLRARGGEAWATYERILSCERGDV